VTARKLLGLLIALIGAALGAFLTGSATILLVGGQDANIAGISRFNLVLIALMGALLGYGIYRLGRRIAR
jgi:hypothetical protein